MMATECITGYARLLENILHFPSDTYLPGSVSQLQVAAWEWSLFMSEIGQTESLIQDSADASIGRPGIVFQVKEKFTGVVESTNTVYNGVGAWPFLHHGSLYRGLSLVGFSIGLCLIFIKNIKGVLVP